MREAFTEFSIKDATSDYGADSKNWTMTMFYKEDQNVKNDNPIYRRWVSAYAAINEKVNDYNDYFIEQRMENDTSGYVDLLWWKTQCPKKNFIWNNRSKR